MALPEIHSTEHLNTLTVTVCITGATGEGDLNKLFQELQSAIFEFNEKAHRASPPRLKLFLSNWYGQQVCAITGNVFEGGGLEYVMDENAAVHPDFVKEIDPTLYEAGEMLRGFYDRLLCSEIYHKQHNADCQRLDRVLSRIMREELYRKVKLEALKQRLELLFKNVPVHVPVYVPAEIPFDDDVPF